MGIVSRRQAESWIESGRVAVNGEKITEFGVKIDPTKDKVAIDGRLIQDTAPPKVYWLLHKPDKTIVSEKAQDDRQTIYQLPSLAKVGFRVFSVGRLDYRSEGLLLISTDGELVHRLTHPKYKIPRHYYVLIAGKLTSQQESEMRSGIALEDGPVKRVELKYAHGQSLGKDKGSWYFISVYEGRNRLVRRLFEHFDHKVVRLVRYGFGELRLPEDLPPGEYRQLTADQIRYLKSKVGLKGENNEVSDKEKWQ